MLYLGIRLRTTLQLYRVGVRCVPGEPIVAPKSIGKTDLSALPIARGRFEQEQVSAYLAQIFDAQELAAMSQARVDRRMVFGINPYYHALACGSGLRDASGNELLPEMPQSQAILALVLPRLAETENLAGEPDPSNQMRYTPSGSLAGKLLHKYDEIVLGHAAIACSAHCRYCYRADLFNRTTGKGWIRPEELRDYVITHNGELARQGELDPATGRRRFPVREVLLSGGDPMVMGNAKLYCYLEACGQAGVNMVRIGTKELAFRPQRFDQELIRMLCLFHERWPDVHLNIVSHFSHPDEFLERSMDGSYIARCHHYKWLAPVQCAAKALLSLNFVSIDNQTPIIRKVNDDADALRLLHQELRQAGIRSKYVLQCRHMKGYRAFAVPLEQAWAIHNRAMQGLSDAARSRFVMSTEDGKIEVLGMTGGHQEDSETDNTCLPAGRDLIFFKIYRSPSRDDNQGEMLIACRNPKAFWLSDYEDRFIHDGRSGGAARLQALLGSRSPSERYGNVA